MTKGKGKRNISEIVTKTIAELQSKKRRRNNHKIRYFSKNEGVSTAGIIKNLLRIYFESSPKDARKEKESKEEILEATPVEEEQPIANGGYGTISKSDGYAPPTKYVNYNKLWDHLGSFRSKGMYEDFEKGQLGNAKDGTETTREMVSLETMEKASKHFKYFVVGDIVGDFGFVPPVGINIDSKEWEKYRLMSMMSIYRPLFALKRSSA